LSTASIAVPEAWFKSAATFESSSGLSLQLRRNRRSDNRKLLFALKGRDSEQFVGMGLEIKKKASKKIQPTAEM
jgi:hypothetical protein